MTNRKPLHPYEQSMLLVAMLFDRTSVTDILKFLPHEQNERMTVAKEKFSILERNERMTHIILELRRLLLIDEHNIDWIHRSWINDALAKEPSYLKPLIVKALYHRSYKENSCLPSTLSIPLSVVFGAFIRQIKRSPRKIAIYDPILMRLQDLKDETQEETFYAIGCCSLETLANAIDRSRLQRYLARKEPLPWPSMKALSIESNLFTIDNLRRYFLHQLAYFRPQKGMNYIIFAGLIITGLYLLSHKKPWQKAITLGLHKKLGEVI